ncbi:MAG: Exodeoxyribonuclease 7 large subunit [Candidatus Omnitrophica bacterium]|nr:Exodeoxyribonuclease 7 large subunit [Candidatus Omnitrophota bacterium]
MPADPVYAPIEAPSQGRRVLSVSELTRGVRFTLERQYASVWVEGEISNLKDHSSGHTYFTLKDAEAQLACVLFARERVQVAFELEEGRQVLCHGRLSVYPARGQYQLYVDRIEPKGLGALQARFLRLRAKLEAEGLFAEERKRPLPPLPGTIGIVTSIDGAALRDILTVLERRHAEVRVIVRPVPVQGETAAPAIAEAIEDLGRHGEAEVLIVGRGGGSLEDLWAFNEEIVARAIAASPVPVISAVGHEIDYTISDFVADLRAPTPSAAAELVLPERAALLAELTELSRRSLAALRGALEDRAETLRRVRASAVLKDPLAAFAPMRQRLDELWRALGSDWRSAQALRAERLASRMARLETLGPLSTLRRGFSVTRRTDGRLVRSAADVKPGETVETVLADGVLSGRVEKIIMNRKGE